MTTRSYYSANISSFMGETADSILGKLVQHHSHDLEHQQRNAWRSQIEVLKDQLASFDKGHIFFEFSIPRMGKRADAVLVHDGFIFVIEFKIGADSYLPNDREQVEDYALDLKTFHAGSHRAPVVPLLLASRAPEVRQAAEISDDGLVYPVLCANGDTLRNTIQACLKELKTDQKLDYLVTDALAWAQSAYKPTPTIVEAAQALYQGHSVENISRSDAGAENLTKTASAINQIIDQAKNNSDKVICFITGVPGAGKTLAGLNIATSRMKVAEEEHAVFLSGNGPLVDVLREALARDEVARTDVSKSEAKRKAKTFIQNIHHFRDDNLIDSRPPAEKVVVFDEAQRAWDIEHTKKFMQQKKGRQDFDLSEPEFLIQVMDRHADWCVIIALIGGGQEINSGEAGLPEWFDSLKRSFGHWKVYYSPNIASEEYIQSKSLASHLTDLDALLEPQLHLGVSIRSFRAEKLSAFIQAVVANQPMVATELYKEIKDSYPIVLTRDIDVARSWLKRRARGSESFGLVASSGGIRLKPEGVYVKAAISVEDWFLSNRRDVRSSRYMEDVATEFHVQGLELDWVGVCWDADFRYEKGNWTYNNFVGSKWQLIKKPESQQYLANAYRVLLTRARQGMIIFIPRGNNIDPTRPRSFYDGVYELLSQCGLASCETVDVR